MLIQISCKLIHLYNLRDIICGDFYHPLASSDSNLPWISRRAQQFFGGLKKLCHHVFRHILPHFHWPLNIFLLPCMLFKTWQLYFVLGFRPRLTYVCLLICSLRLVPLDFQRWEICWKPTPWFCSYSCWSRKLLDCDCEAFVCMEVEQYIRIWIGVTRISDFWKFRSQDFVGSF